MKLLRSRSLRRVLAVLVVAWTGCQATAWMRAWLSAGSEMSAFAPSGAGYTTHSTILSAVGRQYVRRDVRMVLEDAFLETYLASPQKTFVLGETGWRGGATLWPHASHGHGTSVDVFFPVVDAAGEPVSMTYAPWNLWGYCHRFDEKGRYAGTRWEAEPVRVPIFGRVSPCFVSEQTGSHRIDFEAAARFLSAVDRRAQARGRPVKTIIVAPELVPLLVAAGIPPKLEAKLTRHAVWIRHDEHFHIEFVQ